MTLDLAVNVLDMAPRSLATKAADKFNFFNTKSFCTSKDNTNKAKRQPTEQERIFASDESDKRLISRI
jgi:hypothetical protein